MSHNRDLSAAAAQIGFHSSNIGIGSEAPRYALDVYNSNLLVSGSSAGSIILEDRGVGDSSRPFHVVSSDGGKFVINRSNRNASGTTTGSVNSLTLSSSGNLGLGVQTSPASNIHIADLSANGYELKISGNALQFNRSSSSYIDQLHDTGRILFRTGSSNTETMRIESDGKIGINDTSPDANLSVGGSTAFVDIGAAGGNRAKIGYSSNDCYFGTSSSSGQFIFKNNVSSNDNPASSGSERLRITSDGHLIYDTNNGGIYNFDKACSANASTNIFRISNDHGAHCFTIYMTGSNSGNSVSKIYHVACQFGANPTISSAADSGGYSGNDFSLTGSVSSHVHTFAISVTGAAATISCTVVLGSMNTSATVTVL